MAKVLSVRVDDDLAAWVEGYAVERGVRRAQVLEGALREFRGLCASGVPDLPVVKVGGRPRAGVASASVQKPVAEASGAKPSSRLEELRAIAAGHAARQNAERDRKHAERGW